MQMKMDNSKISHATVYNNLHTLAENGKIIRISEPGSPDRYDNTSRHDHLICTVCGKISVSMKRTGSSHTCVLYIPAGTSCVIAVDGDITLDGCSYKTGTKIGSGEHTIVIR